MSYDSGAYVYHGGYTEAVLVALSPTDDASSSIHLTPSPCGSSGFQVLSDDKSDPVKIVLELHKDFPPRMTGSNIFDGQAMSCKVRQIPAVAAEIDLSSGTYAREEFIASSTTATKDSYIYEVNNYNPVDTESVSDIISFSVSHSASLHYQPDSKVTVVPTGRFLDKWGNSVSPIFAKPGEEIVEVDWVNEHTYRNPRSRTVQEDEIVALTSGNKTIDVYGAAKVTYTIKFKVFNVTFRQTTDLRPEDGWENIHMIATYEGQAAYLPIEAPSIKEK